MIKPRVLITESLAKNPLDWLGLHAELVRYDQVQAPSRELLYEQIGSVEAIIVRTYTIIDQKLLDHAPNLRVVARAGVGLDNIDLDACRNHQIPVVHTPTANTQSVVEYVTQMMLNALRSLTQLDSVSTGDDWHTIRESAITPRTCVGATLGIIGFGKIGSKLGLVARSLGMNVVYFDLNEVALQSRHGCTPVSIEELAKSCDVVSIHVDGRSENTHFLSDSFFKLLKPDVILINSSRGFVINEQRAANFASHHPDAQLILDVHSPEPVTSDSPFIGLSNVVRTPHIAAATAQAKENMSWVVRDVVRVLNGEPPEHQAI